MKGKNLICLLTGLILCIPLRAQSQLREDRGNVSDSAFVFSYPACTRMFKVNYGENRQTLHLLRQRLQTFTTGRDTLYVNGFCGKCSDSSSYRRIAYHRSNNLKGYLINTMGLRERDFRTTNHLSASSFGDGEVVIISFLPGLPQKGNSERKSDTPVVTPPPAESKDNAPVSVEGEKETISPDEPQTVKKEMPVATESSTPENKEEETILPVSSLPSSGRYVALKTNLAAWAGTILNIAADVQVGKHVSVELPVLWCPWYVSDRHAVKTFTIQPEARYWLAKPGGGHFFGLHAHVGWFNVKWDRDRYQDADRPLLGAGISYGYLLPFNEHWAGEFTLGAGYANMRYDTYYNIDNGTRIDTRTKNYWGITRVGISVVYRFNGK